MLVYLSNLTFTACLGSQLLADITDILLCKEYSPPGHVMIAVPTVVGDNPRTRGSSCSSLAPGHTLSIIFRKYALISLNMNMSGSRVLTRLLALQFVGPHPINIPR